MSSRRSTAALGLAAVSLLLISVSFPFATDDWPLPALSAFALWIAVAAGVGALVASRRPDNAIGWILLATALSIGAGLFTTVYSAWAIEARHGSVPFGLAAAWLQSWLFVPAFGLLLFLVLLFPTGRLASPRWRWVARSGAAGTVVLAVSFAFKPGPLEALPSVANPLGIPGASPVLEPLQTMAFATLAAAVLAALASVILRLRRARGDERQQVKWFAYTALALGIAIVLSGTLSNSLDIELLGFIPWYVALLAMPIAIGTSILRYRLYDIDRIISRTVSYGLVTGVLAGVYVGLVVLFQRVLGPLAQGSDLAVAASTLLVAAAFVPVRRRVRDAVDRRFNRARYDAARTIEGFSTRLREQVDIDALHAELTDVVRRTMQPVHISIWMRP